MIGIRFHVAMKRNSEIITYKFKSGFPHEIELVSLKSSFEESKRLLIEPHRADFYHILWFKKGRPTHLVDFIPIRIHPGTFLFIGKGRVLMFDKMGDYDGMALRFTDAFFCRNPEDSHYLSNTPLFNSCQEIPTVSLNPLSRKLICILEQIQDEIPVPTDPYQHVVLQNLVHNFLILAERQFRPRRIKALRDGGDLQYGEKFSLLLDANFKTLKQVAEYAGKISVTGKKLSKAISKVFGKSPKEMIDDRIILEAKRLLLYSSASIKEISHELGFDEPTNFIKYFRKHVAQTPNAFRARYLIGTVPDLP